MIYALIVLSCVYGDTTCEYRKTYFQTEAECGRHAQQLGDRLAAEKPKSKVTYFCYAQEPTA